MSSAGRAENSNGCVTRPKGREIGLSGFAAQIQLCSLTGSYVMATAEHREPYESRGSRTVLGARGGEIPPRDSTRPNQKWSLEPRQQQLHPFGSCCTSPMCVVYQVLCCELVRIKSHLSASGVPGVTKRTGAAIGGRVSTARFRAWHDSEVPARARLYPPDFHRLGTEAAWE
jgi:hypothetical protein